MNWILISVAVVVAIAALVAWASRQTAKRYARFQPKDVEEALVELVSDDARDHDTWDLFLSRPIDDPYLESVRQQCLAIVRECPRTHDHEDISQEGQVRVKTLLQELRLRGGLPNPPDAIPTKRSSEGPTTV